MSRLSRDALISRLTRELYDVKYKLEEIRKHAEFIEKEIRGTTKLNPQVLYAAIAIINIVDDGYVYETVE